MLVRKMMKKNEKGFSLIELMVVVAIIGILAAIGIPQYAKFQARARQSEAKSALSALYSSEQSFFGEWNQYSVDLRNIGFAVQGSQLRYNTGFDAVACTNYIETNGAPAEEVNLTNTLANGANVNLLASGAAGPGGVGNAAADGTGTPASWHLGFTTDIATVPGGSSCVNPLAGAGQALFTAISFGSPRNTFAPAPAQHDRWTVNQAKVFSNILPGI